MNELSKEPQQLAVVEKRGELAVAAMAAKAKAEIESRFVIAKHPANRRNVDLARTTILSSCKREAFARGAIYRKPVGGEKTVDGFSIRFAEEAIKAMGNISSDTMTIYEDEDRRIIHITVTDLESNTTYGDEVSISKTVERRKLKEGQVALSQRRNSYGDIVFLVPATDDDLLNKINAAKSKVLRNSGLRLVPQDILEEAWDAIVETMQNGGSDPQKEKKRVVDAFMSLNINPGELERYLKHSLDTISPKELNELRNIYTAIKDEETTWGAVMETAAPKKPAKNGPGDDGDLGPQQASGVAGTITQAAIDKPYEHLKKMLTDDKEGPTELQVLRFMQQPKIKLAMPETPELCACKDEHLRAIIVTYKDVRGKALKMPNE